MINTINEIVNITSEDVQREIAAEEIDIIFGITPVDFVDYKMLDAVYKKTARRCNHHWWGLAGVYLTGYIYGIRAERRRRKYNRNIQEKY